MRKLQLLCLGFFSFMWTIAHAEEQAPVTKEKAQNWLDTQFYTNLVARTGSLAKEDYDKIDDILYKVVIVKSEEISTLEATLNKLGKESWDLFNVHYSSSGDVSLLLKKPAVSYLEKVKYLR